MALFALDTRITDILRLFRLTKQDALFLCGYGICFFLLHWAARPWGGDGFFSLWYPPAGLRYAALWMRGVRFTPWLIVAEVTVGLGEIEAEHWGHQLLAMSRPGV